MDKLKPTVHAMPDGRIAIYIGAAYAFLPLDKAVDMLEQLNCAVGQVRARLAHVHGDAPELFAVQLQQWYDGLRTNPPSGQLAEARRVELDGRLERALAAEARS